MIVRGQTEARAQLSSTTDYEPFDQGFTRHDSHVGVHKRNGISLLREEEHFP